MSEFGKRPLSEVIKLQRGFDLPNSERREGEYPVIGSTAVSGFHDEYKVLPPVVTTGRSGSLGQVVLSKVASWPLNTTLWVKDFKGNDPVFIYYMMQTLGLERFNAGAGVPTLNRNHVDSLEAPLPPLATQRKIAAVLSAYDDLIENNTRRVRVLEQMARACTASGLWNTASLGMSRCSG